MTQSPSPGSLDSGTGKPARPGSLDSGTGKPARPGSLTSGTGKPARPGEAGGAAGPSHGTIRGHLVETARLGLPVMLARSGTLVIITTDVIMTGRVSALELAYYGLAFGLTHNLYVIGMGVMTGCTVLASQADGMGKREICGTVWKVGLFHALALGLLFAGLCLFARDFFNLTGQSEEMSRLGGRAAWMFAAGIPAALMYMASAQFLEGVSRPIPNVVLMAAAIMVNLGLNWVMIHPHDWPGWEAVTGLGGVGAALATTLTRWGMFLGLGAWVWFMPGAAELGIRGPLRHPLDIGAKLRRLGLPLGVAHGLETGAFTALVLFAGMLGPLHMAVYQIANNLFNVVYMLAIGLATATSVRVGNAVGRLDRPSLQKAGWSGVGMGLVLLTAICLVFRSVPEFLVGLYTSDPAVLALGIAVLPAAGLFLIVDGGQGILVGALRGAGDIWAPAAMVTAGFWGVTVTLGYYLAFVMGNGVAGLIWALAAGALTAFLLLLLRFHLLSRREIQPL